MHNFLKLLFAIVLLSFVACGDEDMDDGNGNNSDAEQFFECMIDGKLFRREISMDLFAKRAYKPESSASSDSKISISISSDHGDYDLDETFRIFIIGKKTLEDLEAGIPYEFEVGTNSDVEFGHTITDDEGNTTSHASQSARANMGRITFTSFDDENMTFEATFESLIGGSLEDNEPTVSVTNGKLKMSYEIWD